MITFKSMPSKIAEMMSARRTFFLIMITNELLVIMQLRHPEIFTKISLWISYATDTSNADRAPCR